MKKLLNIFPLLLSITLAYSALAEESCHFGAIVSLTGPANKNGVEWLSGAKYAVEKLKQSNINCQLIVEDDATNPAQVISGFQKLASFEHVAAVIGGTWDFLAETAYPLAQKYSLPFITPTNPIEILSPAALANHFVFTNGLSLTATEAAIEKFVGQRGFKTFAVVAIEVPYGLKQAELIRQLAAKQNAKLLVDRQVSYAGFMADLKSAALAISKAQPDFVFVVLNYEGVDYLLKELEARQSFPTVLVTHTLKEAYEFAKQPKRYQKVYGVYQGLADNKFALEFERATGKQPYGYAANGFDAVMFLGKAWADGALKDGIANGFLYNGVTGEHRVRKETRELVSTKAVITTMQAGRLVEVP